MHELTHKNHFKFGYNHEWFRFRENPEDDWMVSYGTCSRLPKSFKEECYLTASLIKDTSNEPITVLFSGGADSEVVVRSFHDQGIPFKAAILQFNDNINIIDVSYAVACCEQLGIRYNVIQLDVNKFLAEDIYRYAERSQARSPELCTTMWLADQVDGIPVIGSGECYIIKRLPKSYVDGVSPYERTPWDLRESELIASWYRHFMIPGQERKAVPGFFQYTPEIMLSFLKDRKVVDLVNDRVIGKRSTNTSKLGIYQKYFPLAFRNKKSGFENIIGRTLELVSELRDIRPYHAAQYFTEYHDLINILEGNEVGPKGELKRNLPETMVSEKKKSFIDETRMLSGNDYDQVIELLEERFSTVIEFEKAKKRNMIQIDDGFDDFRDQTLTKWKNVISGMYLQGETHKLFGSFHRGKLMSMVGMRLVFEDAWVLSNLKAREVPLSLTGLKETMTILYKHAKDLGLKEYYCSVAKYRYEKFSVLMKKLVPEYYNEYEPEIIETIPTGGRASNDFWWGMMGRTPPLCDVVIKKMRLK